MYVRLARSVLGGLLLPRLALLARSVLRVAALHRCRARLVHTALVLAPLQPCRALLVRIVPHLGNLPLELPVLLENTVLVVEVFLWHAPLENRALLLVVLWQGVTAPLAHTALEISFYHLSALPVHFALQLVVLPQISAPLDNTVLYRV